MPDYRNLKTLAIQWCESNATRTALITSGMSPKSEAARSLKVATTKAEQRFDAGYAAAQQEIARLRAALESASNYIDNLGGVSKTFRCYLNQ